MTVAPVPPVVTLVSVAPNPTAVGTSTTATVTVGTYPLFGPPTGTITVFDTSGNSLCTIALPATSCAFTPTAPGTQTIVARYDGDASYDSGLSNALVLVTRAAPTIAKAFVPRSILVNGTTTLTFTLANPNAATALTGVSFTDTLPAGLVVAMPNGLVTTCSGTVTAVAGTGSIELVNGSLAAGSSCTITASVTGLAGGLKPNTTGAVTSAEGGTGATAGVPRRRRAAGGGAADDRQGVRGGEHRRERNDVADTFADQSQPSDCTEWRGLHRHAARRPRGGHAERANDHMRRRGHRGHRCE